jgi:hypothetical protein
MELISLSLFSFCSSSIMADPSGVVSSTSVPPGSQPSPSRRAFQPLHGTAEPPAEQQLTPDWPVSPISSPRSVSPDSRRLGSEDDSDKENQPPSTSRFSAVVSVRVWYGDGIQRLIGKINGRLATSRSMPSGLDSAAVRIRVRQLERELRRVAAMNPSQWV